MQDAVDEKKLHKPPIGCQETVTPDCLECSSLAWGLLLLTKFSYSHADPFIVISWGSKLPYLEQFCRSGRHEVTSSLINPHLDSSLRSGRDTRPQGSMHEPGIVSRKH
jgi:hypothetical protein